VLNAQVRVFAWSQNDGVEKLDPTSEIVTSPPMVAIEPGTQQVVRIVRLSKRPIVGEENFRVIVDEIPDTSKLKSGEIALTFKHSIPMFVTTATNPKSQLSWAIETQGEKNFIVANNAGNRRVRIGGLTLKSPGDKDFVVGKGLNGYVLSGSSMRWALPKSVTVGSKGAVTITARSDEGPINATAQALASARR
jgi:fimbrial chaperone protein